MIGYPHEQCIDFSTGGLTSVLVKADRKDWRADKFRQIKKGESVA